MVIAHVTVVGMYVVGYFIFIEQTNLRLYIKYIGIHTGICCGISIKIFALFHIYQ